MNESGFYKQFSKNEAVKEEAADVIENQVLPAFKKLGDFVHGEYYDNLRPMAGVNSVRTGGVELYQAFVEYHTTLRDHTPRDIYVYGSEQLEKSVARFVELAESLGYGTGLTFQEAVEAVTGDESVLFEGKNETVQAFVDEIDNINPRLKDLFEEDILGDDVYEVNVKPVPPNGGGIAYYIGPSIDGKRKGKTRLEIRGPVITRSRYDCQKLLKLLINAYKKLRDLSKLV